MLFKSVCLPVDFMYYKHLLSMIGIGFCPASVDTCIFCLVCESHLHTNPYGMYSADWLITYGIIKNYISLKTDNFRDSAISHFVSPTRVFYDKTRRTYFLLVSLLYGFLRPVNLNLSASVSKGKQLQCAVHK